MAIATVSVRVPDDLKKDIDDFEKEERLTQTSEAARKLLMIGIESWRKEKAIQLLEAGKVSFSKAAGIAKLDVWEFSQLVKERKVIWIKNRAMIRDDIKAAR